MIAYKKDWLDNLDIQASAGLWQKSENIGLEELSSIKEKYKTGYKRHGFFLKLGLFLFTTVIVASALGLLCLWFIGIGSRRDVAISIIYLILAVGCYGFAENFVGKNKFVFSGVTEALIYSAVLFVIIALMLLLPNNMIDHEPLVVYTCVLPLLVFPAARFADILLTVCAYVCLLIINGIIVFKFGKIGKMILPFETMALSYAFYSIAVKQKAKENLRWWKNCFTMLEVASLLSLYMAGNYMMVRKLTESLLDAVIEPGQDIDLAWLFYGYSIMVPLAYIWIGLKRRNYVFLRLGLILLVGGILSIKYYHSFMPPETAMILGGIVMILLAYFSIRYLKTPKHGITFDVDERSERHKTMVNLASIAISNTMANQPQPTKTDGPEFGGGDFGGGGAGAEF